MKKLITLLLALCWCLPALAETAEPLPEWPEALAPFELSLPEETAAQTAPGGASVTFAHENGATRAVAMVISRVPDVEGDHGASLRTLMAQFSPEAEEGTPLTLASGCYGLMAVTPGALEGVGGAAIDQVTVMVLWQTAERAELLILSGYDMGGDTEQTRALTDALLRSITVNGTPVLPGSVPGKN